jgi:hypothetical protein
MKSWDIAAYQYKAANYCGQCVVEEVSEDRNMPIPHESSYRDDLAVFALILDIDWEDETSYDSGDFPKVVFADQIEETEHCSKCGEEL